MKKTIEVREKMALLDKMVFGNVTILGFEDLDGLIKRGVVEQTTSKVKYITAYGQEFSKLLIEKDGEIDRLVAGSKLIGNKRVDYCHLSVSIGNKDTGNLLSYTRDEYLEKLQAIEDHLKSEYGIYVDFSDITVKEIEINRTFKLEEDFSKYHRVLNLIMTNLPAYLKNQMDYKKVTKGSSEYETYYATSKTTGKSKKYLLFKIYNKSKSVEKLILLTDSYMRVEFRLVGAEKVKKALKINRFVDLTDEIINDYFSSQVKKIIVKPFNAWKKDRDKYLVELMKQQRERDIRHWQSNVLRVLQNKEIDEKRAVLLDIEELIPLVNKLDLSSNRRCDVKRNFRRQAEKIETVFRNNDHKKMQEIIEKLTVTDTAKDTGKEKTAQNYTGMITSFDGTSKSA